MSRGDTQFKLNLPDGLKRRVSAAAASNGRSITAEVVRTLEAAYPGPVEPESPNEALREAAEEVLEGWEAVIRAMGQDPSQNEALARLKAKIEDATK